MTRVLIALCVLLASCGESAQTQRDATQTPEALYDAMQRSISSGWNTWDTRSVLTHVLLPHGIALDLNLIDRNGNRAGEFRIGERANDAPILHPGAHTYDGAYTDLLVEWHGIKLRVQSAAEGHKNVILVTPLPDCAKGGKLTVTPKYVWLRANRTKVDGTHFTLTPLNAGFELNGAVTGTYVDTKGKDIIMVADQPAVICSDGEITQDEAQAFIQKHSDEFVAVNKQKFGDSYEVYNAMQNVLAWDNIYDPTIRRVITPVSRNWNVGWSANPNYGGFVLFCWDTYFASMMFATGNKELAYANAVEITNGITEEGFVPNFYTESGYKSRDRSQPPVGSLAVWTIYEKYQEKWFLELLYSKLLAWNRWWDKSRQSEGLLCWGSSPFAPVTYRYWELEGVNERFGGALESGLDNSHMYDDIAFDTEQHILKLNDAGLNGLYVMDCECLEKIARELGHSRDAGELKTRGDRYRRNIAALWDEQRGMYYNRHTDTKVLNNRISPTNFYPMLANAPTQAQAKRMVDEHLFNPDEFWGDWVIPATPRNDPAYKDNTYWRGRIWAPMNFLVYMGLRNYDLPEARKALADKSKALILKSWLSDGYVYENYSTETGAGDDVSNSDKFYHWGALLSFISLMEEGYFNAEQAK
ncbi:MAG: hypothetical protein LBU62_04020 [Bacteroidales bacterium]|jgi:hypothetical protein|nr:hypothetical protein [Bacteroidales bacterium]